MPTTRPKGLTPHHWWAFLRPPLVGVALLCLYVAIRVLAFAAGGSRARDAGEVDSAFILAALSGASCGLVYSLLGRPLRKLGVVGNYVAGIVTVFPYFVFLFCLGPDRSERADLREPLCLFAALAASTVVGVFLGREFHEKDNLFKPEP